MFLRDPARTIADNARMNPLVVLCTCPNDASAERIASALVTERLAACVNRIPAVVSIYRWKGEVCCDNECLLMIKTTRERFDALRDRILALHPYELPEVVAVDIALGLAPYLAWIEHETQV
jgi:periplasmic divalent cation tolerance protein